MTDLKIIEEEKRKINSIIKKVRKKIKNSQEVIEIVFEENSESINKKIKSGDISGTIIFLREKVYEYFLLEENLLNKEVITLIGSECETASEVLSRAVDQIVAEKLQSSGNNQHIRNHFNEYAYTIFPYFYELSLSNTNSRRSRSGQTFEKIIYKLYEYFEYNFDAQSKIGKEAFSNVGLGKIVDSILPGKFAFEKFRNKCIVGSMKTSLRERWQEVVEEVMRSNLPNIYLLTVDEEITKTKVEQMQNHNIILVVLKEVKDKLKEYHNVVSFETYFLKNIPEIEEYWRKIEDD